MIGLYEIGKSRWPANGTVSPRSENQEKEQITNTSKRAFMRVKKELPLPPWYFFPVVGTYATGMLPYNRNEGCQPLQRLKSLFSDIGAERFYGVLGRFVDEGRF